MNLKQHVGALLAAVLFGGGLGGCAVEDERPAPYEPQVTHTPKAKKTDGDGTDIDGVDENGVDTGGTNPDSADKAGGEAGVLEPPPIPDAIYEETLEGAEAAARHYLRALEYGFRSSDPEPLRNICDDISETCAEHIEQIELQRDKNRRFVQEALTLEPATTLEFVEDGAYIEVPVYIPEYEIIGERGEDIKSKGSEVLLYLFFAVYNNDQWFMSAIATEDLDE